VSKKNKLGMQTGEINLQILLKNMEPILHQGEYVFCTVSALETINLSKVISIFKEQDAITVILPKQAADQAGLKYTATMGWITLNVHSSLEAVGLTATFSQALAAEGISCNVVAAYYHDHIFINFEYAEKAMSALRKLAETNQVLSVSDSAGQK
jgi:uncharacterized protein